MNYYTLNGICCLSSDNLTWDYSESSEYDGSKILKHCNNSFTNIPLYIPDNSIELLKIEDNYPKVLSSFFGTIDLNYSNGLISILDIDDICKQKPSVIEWKSTIVGNDSISAFNNSSVSAKLSGYSFNDLERSNSENKHLYLLNPYNISIPSADVPKSMRNFKYAFISQNTYPKYSIINLNGKNKIIAKSNGTYTYKSRILISGENGIKELLKNTYLKINYYCDVLYSLINDEWHIDNNDNKPYSYKDLSGIAANNDNNADSLASAIIQYTYGNGYIIDMTTVQDSNICLKNLGTLNKFNWIKWKDFNVTESNLFSYTTVDYTLGINDVDWNCKWITGYYNINDLI